MGGGRSDAQVKLLTMVPRATTRSVPGGEPLLYTRSSYVYVRSFVFTSSAKRFVEISRNGNCTDEPGAFVP